MTEPLRQTASKSKWMRFVEWFDTHKSFVEFIGLCVAIWVLFFYREANELTRQAIQLNQDALQVAQANANAARDGVNVTKDTAQKQLRAYIGIESLYILPPDVSHTQNGMIGVQIKNFGQSPAHDVKIRVCWWRVPIPPNAIKGEMPKDFDYNKTIAGGEPEGIGYFDPTQALNSWVQLDNDEGALFIPSLLKLHTHYIYGSIYYTDIYDTKHARDFCYIYVKNGEQPAQIVVYGQYNDDRVIK